MSSVKDRNREKVDQSEVYRQYRHEGQYRGKAVLGDLARHLRDAQRPAELVGRARADDHLPHRLQRAADDIRGLIGSAHHRSRGIVADVLDALPLDSEETDRKSTRLNSSHTV